MSCPCPCPKCKGKLVSRNLYKYHLRTITKEASLSAARDGPSMHSSNDVALLPPLPQISLGSGSTSLSGSGGQCSGFSDVFSTTEADMLSRGTLTRQDINLQLYGSQLPYLGPNFDCAEDLLTHVQYYELLNAAASSSSRPLTGYEALRDPYSKEDRRFMRQIEDMYETEQNNVQSQAETEPVDAVLQPPPSTEGDAYWQPDYEFDFEVPEEIPEDEAMADDADADDESALPLGNDDEVDPFAPEEAFTPLEFDGDDALADMPSHVVCIYALVTWLHLQFHLPRVACHVVLTCFVVLLGFLAPTSAMPHKTLKAANRALGLDSPVHILPICPTCREVYPASDTTPDLCIHCGTNLFISELTRRGRQRDGRIPSFKYPYLSISEQLPSLLATPGIEDALDAWRHRIRTPGKYEDIFDGEVCREQLRDKDKRAFFSNGSEERRGPHGELRIGLTMGVDWFSYIRSNIAPSHSSCPTSFSICNLPPEHRYRTSNLLLTSILPGPKEQTGDEIQRFLKPIVSDLVRLWRDGILIATPSCPNGRRVRVILVAVICDKPAAHKMGGFGSHSHTFFCTRCWIDKDAKLTAQSFEPNAFRPRTDAQHKEYGKQYQAKTSANARNTFVRLNATRYTELSRLPYFNIVDQVVIDPMHNLFLGLVKTHFYHIWVQGKVLREKHELRRLHEMLADFTVPTLCGKLPKDIGMPAGGSLTADQWLLLATVYGPIVVPQLWSSCLPEDPSGTLNNRKSAITNIEKEKADKRKKAAEKAAATRAAKKKAKEQEQPAVSRKRRRQAEVEVEEDGAATVPAPEVQSAEEPAPDARSQPEPETNDAEVPGDTAFALHPDDPSNFLKLSAALSLIIKRTLTTSDMTRADTLLRDYCKELLTLYGPSVIKPNHHYATHTIDFIRNFGPVHGFWTFVFERLNKVLKSYKANNHAGGELETTFFQEFQRTCQSSRLLYRLGRNKDESMEKAFSDAMTHATQEERGTVASLAAKFAEENDVIDDDTGVPWKLSTNFDHCAMSSELYRILLQQLNTFSEDWHYHAETERPRYEKSFPLSDKAAFYEYVLINGVRYHASSAKGCGAQTLVFVESVDSQGQVSSQCGELAEIFRIDGTITGEPMWFGRMRWFSPWMGFRPSLWTKCYEEMDVRLWGLQEYRSFDDPISPLIALSWIKGHVARSIVKIGGNALWATVPIKKMSNSR